MLYLVIQLTKPQSALPPYATKSVRLTQGDSLKPKRVRKPAARKPGTDNPSASTEPKNTEPKNIEPKNIELKKKKLSKILPPPPCIACGKTTIPLIKGSREYASQHPLVMMLINKLRILLVMRRTPDTGLCGTAIEWEYVHTQILGRTKP